MTPAPDPALRSRSRRWAIWIHAPLVGLIAAAVVVAEVAGIPFVVFTRDVFSTAEVPVYTGLLSNVGILLWAAGVAICLFVRVAGSRADAGGFLLVSALLTAVLLVDDLFMLHEWVIPRVLGIPEEAVLTGYAAAAIAYAAAYRARIRERAPLVFTGAIALLAGSVFLDLLESPPAPMWHVLSEEGLKLLGIGTWLLFLAGAASEPRERLP